MTLGSIPAVAALVREHAPAGELALAFRFGVFFLGGPDPNPLDIRFQKVSGLAAKVTLTEHQEGGQNLYTQRLPERITYDNLVLTRGFVHLSPLALDFHAAMSRFRFSPTNVVVTLLGDDANPLHAWLFHAAFPVRWATSDLDAEQKAVLVDTLELAYTRMEPMGV